MWFTAAKTETTACWSRSSDESGKKKKKERACKARRVNAALSFERKQFRWNELNGI